jgi:hypothetical protein
VRYGVSVGEGSEKAISSSMLRSMIKAYREVPSQLDSLGLWVHRRTSSVHCKHRRILRSVSGGREVVQLLRTQYAVGMGDSPIQSKIEKIW